MKATIKLFLVLITVVVAVIGWITGQYHNSDFFFLILVLICTTLVTFLVMNIHDHRVQVRKRKERESKARVDLGAEVKKIKRSEVSFALKDRKSGLNWGGGNIKASEATRGTKRKFLGK